MTIKRYLARLHDAVQRVEVDTINLVQSVFNSADNITIADETTSRPTIDGYSIYKEDQSSDPINVGAWIVLPRRDLPDNIVTLNGVALTINDDDVVEILYDDIVRLNGVPVTINDDDVLTV